MSEEKTPLTYFTPEESTFMTSAGDEIRAMFHGYSFPVIFTCLLENIVAIAMASGDPGMVKMAKDLMLNGIAILENRPLQFPEKTLRELNS